MKKKKYTQKIKYRKDDVKGFKLIIAATDDPKLNLLIYKDAQKYNIPVVLMHMPGDPTTMMKKNKYFNITLDVYDYLEKRIKKKDCFTLYGEG